MKKSVALILVFCIMSSGFQSRAELAVEQITQTNEIITDSSIPTAEVDTEPTPESLPTETSEPSPESTPELPDPAIAGQTIMSSDRINAEDSDNGDGDGEPLFAEDRVLVKIYSNIFRRSFPDLGIEYSEMHLLNPSKKQEDNGLFLSASADNTQNNVFAITLAEPGKVAVEKALEILNANPSIEIAEPVYLRKLGAIPNDTMYETQYALQKINAEQAWNITTGSKNVVVGVIDTGIDGTHTDLKDNLWINPNPNQGGFINDIYGYNFTGKVGGIPTDQNGHGTHIAGIIGAKGNNGKGISGINWDVSLAWLGIDDGNGYVNTAAAIEALNYANNHNITITNNSYGGGGYSKLEYQAIANYKGVFVASAGNEASNNDGSVRSYPASYDLPNIISVAATDAADNLSEFSNYGKESVHIAAPGGKGTEIADDEILSTWPGDNYKAFAGTSMASPYVAGVAALIKSIRPEYTSQQIKAAICGTVRKTSLLNTKVKYKGIVDAYAALQNNTLYSVTYNYNDSLKTPFIDFVMQGTPLYEPKWPVREGYIFNYWSLVQTNGSAFNFDSALNGNITLYAQWVEATPNIFGTEFPDPNFRYETLRQLNTIDGGSRTSASIVSANDEETLSRIIYLDIGGKSIRDMSGLQFYTGLTTLSCEYNELTKLDISKNTVLIELRCYENKLTELDVSNNVDLLSLRCDWNPITELDLSQNLKLEELICNFMALSELNVSRNIELTTLLCDAIDWFTNHHGDGWNLDLSKNTKLIKLHCNSNGITALDTSNNLLLEKLHCQQNRLTVLDISNNLLLTELLCSTNRLDNLDLSKNIALEWLSCAINRLTVLDISKNIVLEKIGCFDNFLQQLNVTNSSALYDLRCGGNYMKTPDDVIGWQLNPELILNSTFMFYPQNEGNPPVNKDITSEFTDAKFLVAVRDIIGKPDGSIYVFDVAKIWYIDVGYMDISNLSGIEYFINLEYLGCDGNKLAELDVSKNIKLIDFSCNDNQLTELYVLNNIALTSLNCSYNKLTELDVSKNINLTDFSCADNQLTELDVSNNIAITNLVCNGNKLTELDASKNIKLIDFSCAGNQLTELYVSNNIALISLNCNGNKLTEFDVSKNINLIDFSCAFNQLTELDVSNNIAFTHLSCDYNKLTELDVSNSINLIDFSCGGNQLTELDILNNIALTSLNCSYNKLTELDVSNNKSLRGLECDNNLLVMLDLSEHSALQNVYCAYNYIDIAPNSAFMQTNRTIIDKLGSYFSYSPQMQHQNSALTGAATISNTTPKIGDTLTGSFVGGNNTGTLIYVWKANGTQVGTNSATYTVLVGDLGKTITLEIASSVQTGTVTSTATIAVVKKVAPSAPIAPTLVSKTHNSVTLTANALYEFSKDGTTWQASNVFGNLTASTAYTFCQKIAATEDTEESTSSTDLIVTTDTLPINALTGTLTISNIAPKIDDILTGSLVGDNNTGTLTYTWKTNGTQVGTNSATYTVFVGDLGKTITLEIKSSVETGTVTSAATAAVVKKAAPAAPSAPTLGSKTHNSVTLTANALYEFSKDGTTWQASNVFGNLTASTTYTFCQKIAATEDTKESTSSTDLIVTTDTLPINALTGTLTISNTLPKIGDILTGSLADDNNTGTLTYAWKANDTQVGTNSTTYTVQVSDLGKPITLEITSSVETGTVTSTATAAVVKKVAPAAPSAPTLVSKTHNSVTLTANALYEFSKDGTTWQASNVFGNLTASTAYTFCQRIVATADTLASAASSVLNVTTDAPITATGVTLDKTTLSLYSNATPKTETLTATVLPATTTNKTVTWTSSNTYVATVSATGLVTAIATGTATITATTADGSAKTANCVVTVTTVSPSPNPPTSPTLTAYGFTEGQNSVWGQGSANGLRFRIEISRDKYSATYVDGKDVPDNQLTVQSGSTIVTLKSSYLKTLSAGTHTLYVSFIDGSYASTTFTITGKANPQTGMDIPETGAVGNMNLRIVSILSCIISITFIAKQLRRKATRLK